MVILAHVTGAPIETSYNASLPHSRCRSLLSGLLCDIWVDRRCQRPGRARLARDWINLPHTFFEEHSVASSLSTAAEASAAPPRRVEYTSSAHRTFADMIREFW